MPSLSVGGHSLFYLGGPSGPAGTLPVVFLHGAGGSAALWTQLHVALRRERPVYALDLPGHGRSDPLDGPITIERYAGAVGAFLETAGLGPVVLVGHSMGGGVAQVLALTARDRLAGLVLVNSGARLRVRPDLLEEIARDFDAAVERICRLCYGPAAPPAAVARGVAEMRKIAPAVLLGDFRACDRFDVRDRLPSIGVPTLVVGSEQDTMTPPKYAAYLAERIPGARLQLVAGAGHMLPVETPTPLVESLRRFLAEL